MFKKVAILFFLSLVTIDLSSAQDIPIPKDSTHLYEHIETYSDKSKFTRFMFRLFFKPVAPEPPVKIKRRLKQKPYTSFEGKIIRDIKVETLEPFGYSIGDTITASQNILSKAGNLFHIKTQARTIRNLLLIHPNQPFDSLRVKESERLVRNMKYITDVSFYIQATATASDSVDIFIRELDTWSIIPGVRFSASRIKFDLLDNNFLGLGHEFQNGLIWNHAENKYAYNVKYYIPNIKNSYINSTLKYGTDEYGNFVKSFGVDRPFFSPFAKWAAGINFSQNLRKDSILTSNFMHYKVNIQDYWLGSAMRIFKDNSSYGRTTNFISALHFTRMRYVSKPPETIDTLRFFSDENFYLASLGISSRQYVRDKYIFKFGITEDVPIGKVVSLTGGYQDKKSAGRFYFGVRMSSGNYHSWGYLNTNLEYGTFLHESVAEQGVFSASVNYFTGLFDIGRWKLRQFIKPQAIIGINRSAYDSLTINDGYGLVGFNSPFLSGKSRLMFTSQTQTYAPWNFIGFHFGPYLTFSLGMLGDVTKGFRSASLYSQIGLGVLIKNDNLVMNTFQLSLAFYPSIPGMGKNILKINSFQSSDFGFRDFEIGKPAIVGYR